MCSTTEKRETERRMVCLEKIAEENSKHLEVANSEMGAVKMKMEKIDTDVGWLIKFFWVVATSSIGGLITALFTLLMTTNK